MEPSRLPPLRRHVADMAIGAVLFVIAAGVAAWYVPAFAASGGKPRFYQSEFGAAVAVACGRGYVNPDPAAAPALAEFLEQKRTEVACADVAAAPAAPLRPMQRAFRYLMLTVGEVWRIEGRVSWPALTPLFALLYGITAILVFAIFRQGMGAAVATVLSLLLIVSPLQLNNLPHLRDYAKAPFVLALILMAMRLLVLPVSRARTLTLAAGAGLMTGVGMGFRNDVMVAIPAFVALFIVFLPTRPFEQIGLRLSAAALYVATVIVAMLPMLTVYNTGGGNSSQHLVLLGLTPAFSHDLGVDNSHLYELGFEYRDELALAMIDNYSDRRLGRHAFLPMYSADYDRAATGLLRDLAADFPADLLARVYASAVRITALPYSDMTSALIPPSFAGGGVKQAFDLRSSMVRGLARWWPMAFGVSLFALTLANFRLGAAAGLLVFYVAAYPALQFQERHFFHLEFMGWWALGFAVTIIAREVYASLSGRVTLSHIRSRAPSIGWPRTAAMAAGFWVLFAILVVVPLRQLRAYQGDHVSARLQEIIDLPRADVGAERIANPNGSISLRMPGLPDGLPVDEGVHAEYLALDVGGASCDLLEVTITQRYAAVNPNYDFTHPMIVRTPVTNEPLEMFFPVFFRNPMSTNPLQEGFRFTGVELTEPGAQCVTRVARVSAASSWPSLMDLRLAPGWQHATPYATISGVEGRENPPATYASPGDLSRHAFQHHLAAPLTPFVRDDVKNVSPTLTMDGASWKVSGAGGVGGRGPLLYLVEMKDRPLKKHAAFIAEGRIDKGGITFGLVRGVEWIVQLHIRQQGPFSTVIEVPEDGNYRVIMANNLIGMAPDNHVTVTRAGLVAPREGVN